MNKSGYEIPPTTPGNLGTMAIVYLISTPCTQETTTRFVPWGCCCGCSLAKGGTPAKFLIIDDGWQSVTENTSGYMGSQGVVTAGTQYVPCTSERARLTLA